MFKVNKKQNILQKTKNYYSKKDEIKGIILRHTGKNEVIYGQFALNVQLPPGLRVHTEDIDIYTKNPKKEAKELEKALDNYFGGNYFMIKPAKYPQTFRVISKTDGKVIADYTLLKNKVPINIINGIKYVTLQYIKKERQKTIKNPEAKFRRAKDKDALNRILLAEKMRRIF